MSNKKHWWELRLGSKVDSLTLCFQTTKPFLIAFQTSICATGIVLTVAGVCEVSIDETLSILNVKSKQCMRVCLLSTSVLVLVCKHVRLLRVHVHASVLLIRPQKFKDPSWLRHSFEMRCCKRFLGWIQLFTIYMFSLCCCQRGKQKLFAKTNRW